MHLSVISDLTYRSSLPYDPICLGFYGSETYHAILVKVLAEMGHQIEWYAVAGSTTFDDNPNVNFHPMHMDFGQAQRRSILDDSSYEKLSYTELLKTDFVMDLSSDCGNIEQLYWYHNFKNFLCYRNGYVAFTVPRINPNLDRHYVVPSKQNAGIFAKSGFPSIPAYYGIDEFYSPKSDGDEYFEYFVKQYNLEWKNFFLFLHRPTVDKGIDTVYQLAKDLKDITFVVAGHENIAEHNISLLKVMRDAAREGVENLKIVSIPMNPRHHYYKRALYRAAKAFLSPFKFPEYLEGFGLATAECISCGTPTIVTDSPSTHELWIDGKDALFIDSYRSIKQCVEYFDAIGNNLRPENKFPVKSYGEAYIQIAENIMNGTMFV